MGRAGVMEVRVDKNSEGAADGVGVGEQGCLLCLECLLWGLTRNLKWTPNYYVIGVTPPVYI